MEDTKQKPYSEMTIEELRVLAKKGDAKAQNNIGSCYYNGCGAERDLKKSVKWWMKSAEQGYSVAQNNLALCYLFGEGVR